MTTQNAVRVFLKNDVRSISASRQKLLQMLGEVGSSEGRLSADVLTDIFEHYQKSLGELPRWLLGEMVDEWMAVNHPKLRRSIC
jgi:hypothetical protein